MASQFPPKIVVKLEEALKNLGSCTVDPDQPKGDPPGCGRSVSEFVLKSEGIEFGGRALKPPIRLAVQRWRCPCGRVWTGAVEWPDDSAEVFKKLKNSDEPLILDGVIQEVKRIMSDPKEMEFLKTGTFKVTATCEIGHTQTITFIDQPRSAAELYAGLLDGTSDVFLSKPCDDPRSVIGKCCWNGCGKPFKCTVEEVVQGDESS